MLIKSRLDFLAFQRKSGLCLILMLVHFLVGNIGLLFHGQTMISPFWPPSGFGLAIFLIFGFFPGVMTVAGGELLLGLMGQASLISILGLTSATVLEGALSYLLLTSLRIKILSKSPKDILTFILVGAVVSPFVSATIAITALYMGGMFELHEAPSHWLTFFAGNSLGILVFTPLVMSFLTGGQRKYSPREFYFSILLLMVNTFWSLNGDGIRTFSLIPILMWISIRYSFRGISLAALLIGTFAIWKSTAFGPLFMTQPEEDILILQCMTAGIAIIGYFLATLIESHDMANEKEIQHNINVQHMKVTEEALAILDQTINDSSIGYALYDKDLKYLRINKKLARINCRPAEQHLGRSIYEMIPEVADKIAPVIQTVFKTGESFHNIPFFGTIETLDLNNFAALLSYYPVRNPATNEIFAVATSVQDISDVVQTQTLLRQNQDRLAFAQEAGKIGAFEVDLFTKRILWTRQLEEIYGLHTGTFMGSFSHWSTLIHPDDKDKFMEIMEEIAKGHELNIEFRILRNNNQIRWILARGRVLNDHEGHPERFIGINIDLTEQKETEFKLRVTEANLLHALSIRDEFVAIASHELKTPLTSLKLQTQFIQRCIGKENSVEKLQSYVEKNSRQIERITRLVDDMLDISRIRTGKFTLQKEPCELSAILHDVISRSKENFESCGSGMPLISHLETAHGEWDPLRIEQVVTNIVNNAIRYGEGKSITISLVNMQECVRLSVTDQGKGITKSDQEKIFHRYERGILNKEVSGLGLGLFICQQIVEAHGGIIWVESEINMGATFHIDLPRTSIPVIIAPASLSNLDGPL